MQNQPYDILLTICPPYDVSFPPIGLAYLSAYLEKRGFRPKVIDLNIELYYLMSEEIRNILWDFSNFRLWERRGFMAMGEDFEKYISFCLECLLPVDTKIFGFSLYHANVGLSVEIAKRIKEVCGDAEIIFGGPSCIDPFDCSKIPPELGKHIVQGDGEFTLAELLSNMKKGCDVKHINGIFAKRGEGHSTNAFFIPNLEDIPFPTYQGFELPKYTANKQLRLIASRGCIARCRFCNENYYSGEYRSIRAEKVFGEIRYHVEQNDINSFFFSDQAINSNLVELEKLCDLILAYGYEIKWTGQGIARKGMTLELLEKMRKAGCFRIEFGVETGSEAIMRKMKKPHNLEVVESVLTNSHNSSITTCINIIVGFPGEGEKELGETMEFLRRNRNHIHIVSNISTCFIKPFSDLHLNPQNYGVYIPDKPYFWYLWQDRNVMENRDNEQRISKLKRVVSACGELGLPVENTFYFKED